MRIGGTWDDSRFHKHLLPSCIHLDDLQKVQHFLLSLFLHWFHSGFFPYFHLYRLSPLQSHFSHSLTNVFLCLRLSHAVRLTHAHCLSSVPHGAGYWFCQAKTRSSDSRMALTYASQSNVIDITESALLLCRCHELRLSG